MNKFIVLGLSMVLLAGCNTLKRATGQIDDSTLPGQRTDILPSDQTTQRDPAVVGADGAVTQTPIDGAAMPGMPKAKANDVVAGCDPAVDLCPDVLAPEPVPPISPRKVKLPDAAPKVPAADKVVDGTEVVDGTKVLETPKVVTKKKKKKKLTVPKVTVPGVPTPPTPTPPVPKGQ